MIRTQKYQFNTFYYVILLHNKYLNIMLDIICDPGPQKHS